ncbi:MAG: ChbG/HpnK family deacetylase [Thermomicrobiales bacterium]
MSGRKQLIVNADDFGRSPGINRGILEAHLHGIVTSTTLMVNTRWSESSAEILAGVPGLAVGLHLNFCYGQPVSEVNEVPSLLSSDGTLNPSIRELLRTADPNEIRTETTAQVRRFQRIMGRMPSHLDSHKYLHSNPPFRSIVAEVASSHALPVRATSGDDRAELAALRVATTGHFEGRFHGLDGEGVDQALLDRIILEMPCGTTELMCHPGYVDADLLDSSYRDDREHELLALCSSETRKRIDEAGIQLIDFSQLAVKWGDA